MHGNWRPWSRLLYPKGEIAMVVQQAKSLSLKKTFLITKTHLIRRFFVVVVGILVGSWYLFSGNGSGSW